MDVIESKLRSLLVGDSIGDSANLCDFTLLEQNEATAAKGVTPVTPSSFVPVVKNTVTYIVMAVLFNDDGDVLLMQEAKRSCAGQWYLPAGRMEPNENIVDAVKREVLEETGLIMEPTTLIMVECASKAWFRFVLTGNITGGTLKTPAQADSESLQAKWVQNINELSLRANDIVPVIEKGRTFRNEPHHPNLLPALHAHDKLLLRLIVCIKQKSRTFQDVRKVLRQPSEFAIEHYVCHESYYSFCLGESFEYLAYGALKPFHVKKCGNSSTSVLLSFLNRIHVLLSEKTEVHFPICEINHMKNLHSTLRKFMVDIFGADVPAHKPHGVINVEHCAKGAGGVGDGICMTVLVSFRVPLEDVFPIDKYTWLMINKDLGQSLSTRLPRNMAVPLNVIR